MTTYKTLYGAIFLGIAGDLLALSGGLFMRAGSIGDIVIGLGATSVGVTFMIVSLFSFIAKWKKLRRAI